MQKVYTGIVWVYIGFRIYKESLYRDCMRIHRESLYMVYSGVYIDEALMGSLWVYTYI